MLLAVMAVTAFVYWPGLWGSWLFDDYPNIVENPGVHMHHVDVASITRAALSSPSSVFKRPLTSLTFAANYLLDGLHPFGWKFANLLIHLLNGLLFYFLARGLLGLVRAPPGIQRTGPARTHHAIVAACIAGAWMLLPINLTGVLYVVQRMESLANVFVLLGLLGYLAGRRRMLRPGGQRRHRAIAQPAHGPGAMRHQPGARHRDRLHREGNRGDAAAVRLPDRMDRPRISEPQRETQRPPAATVGCWPCSGLCSRCPWRSAWPGCFRKSCRPKAGPRAISRCKPACSARRASWSITSPGHCLRCRTG